MSKTTVLLTGASQGLGTYIAEALCEKQYKVIGVARNKDLLKQQADKLGPQFIAKPYDLSDLSGLQDFFSSCLEEHGPIQILINNAAIERYTLFKDADLQTNRNILDVNLLAPMELTRQFLMRSEPENYRHIINISSLAGKKATVYNSAYSASKAGLLLWADALDQEISDRNTYVSTICPGFVTESGMAHNLKVEAPTLLGSSLPKEVATAVLKTIKNPKKEVIVNPGPMRLLLGLGQMFPGFENFIMKILKIKEINSQKISKQRL